MHGLRWSDIDFEHGLVSVRRQVDRDGVVSSPKTKNANRQVLLLPALARMLRQHRIASSHSRPDDYVFSNAGGGPLRPETVRRYGLIKALQNAGLNHSGKNVRFHDLRHTYASLLMAQGMNVAFVSRQMGHASIATTLGTYTHLFDRAEHGKTLIAGLEGRFADILQPLNSDPESVAEVVALGLHA